MAEKYPFPSTPPLHGTLLAARFLRAPHARLGFEIAAGLPRGLGNTPGCFFGMCVPDLEAGLDTAIDRGFIAGGQTQAGQCTDRPIGIAQRPCKPIGLLGRIRGQDLPP